MSREAVFSKVGTRMSCGIALLKLSHSKDFGVVTSVRMTRISFLVWHLQCDVKVKE